MKRTVELVGGNLDGLRLSRSSLPPYAWVDRRGFFFRRPRSGAVLYRRAGVWASGSIVDGAPQVVERGTRYVYAPGYRLCPGCSVLHAPADSCSLCGTALVT